MIDVVLEVRDARAPLSTQFPFLDELIPSDSKKSRVIVFNKIDLANLSAINKIKNHIESSFKEMNKPVPLIHFTQSMQMDNKNHPKHPIQMVKNAALLHRSKYPLPLNLTNTPHKKEINMLVVGLPNVGKSTLINSIRSASGMKKSAKMGALPGVTRDINGFQACLDPPVFVVDTPGIMIPGNLPDKEQALTLCLLGMISDKIVDVIVMADFLLYKLCQINKSFISKLGIDKKHLQTHGDDIHPFLLEICKIYNLYLPSNKPDTVKAARFFINKFRKAEFGPYTFDNNLNATPPTPTSPLPDTIAITDHIE